MLGSHCLIVCLFLVNPNTFLVHLLKSPGKNETIIRCDRFQQEGYTQTNKPTYTHLSIAELQAESQSSPNHVWCLVQLNVPCTKKQLGGKKRPALS